jgi:hypothetical protein
MPAQLIQSMNIACNDLSKTLVCFPDMGSCNKDGKILSILGN